MKFVLLLIDEPDHTDADEDAAPLVDEWLDWVYEHNVYEYGVKVDEEESNRTVRVRQGELTVTGGNPNKDRPETLLAVCVIESPTFDDAIDIAARNPVAFSGRIEVRPVYAVGGRLGR